MKECRDTHQDTTGGHCDLKPKAGPTGDVKAGREPEEETSDILPPPQCLLGSHRQQTRVQTASKWPQGAQNSCRHEQSQEGQTVPRGTDGGHRAMSYLPAKQPAGSGLLLQTVSCTEI